MSPALLKALTEQTGLRNGAVIALLADQAAASSHEIKEVEIGGRKMLSVPDGRTIESYERFLPHPHRMSSAQAEAVNDAASLLKLIQRFPAHPRLVEFSLASLTARCVLNYSTDEKPGWGDCFITWKLNKHRDLLAWETRIAKPIPQVEFIEFLEDHVEDVKDAPMQSILLKVASELEVTSSAKFKSARDVHNGNFVLHCEMEGKTTVEVPREFSLGLPIFEGLAIAYELPVRLNYTVTDGNLNFRLAFKNLNKAIDLAWAEVVESITSDLPEGVPFIHVP